MNSEPEDLARLATADDRDRTHGFVCACGARPTCPMLLDKIWDQIKPEPVVTIKVLNLRNGEKREHRTERMLLCMTCAETRLGRAITIDDLAVCVGNYGAAIMLRRERDLLDEALDLLARVDSYTDHAETLAEAAARIAKAAGR